MAPRYSLHIGVGYGRLHDVLRRISPRRRLRVQRYRRATVSVRFPILLQHALTRRFLRSAVAGVARQNIIRESAGFVVVGVRRNFPRYIPLHEASAGIVHGRGAHRSRPVVGNALRPAQFYLKPRNTVRLNHKIRAYDMPLVPVSVALIQRHLVNPRGRVIPLRRRYLQMKRAEFVQRNPSRSVNGRRATHLNGIPIPSGGQVNGAV